MDYEYRARCLRVIDGDTLDLEVDLGFYMRASMRFRLRGIDTPELRAKDPAERSRAQAAKDFVLAVTGAAQGFSLDAGEAVAAGWGLMIKTHKADSFGRWLADVSFLSGADSAGRLYYDDLGSALIDRGLARPWRKN